MLVVLNKWRVKTISNIFHNFIFFIYATGLFQRAIAQSGSALASWTQVAPDLVRERARAFGILSGCPVKSTQKLAECLRAIPATEFFETHDKCKVSIEGD